VFHPEKFTQLYLAEYLPEIEIVLVALLSLFLPGIVAEFTGEH